MTKTLGQFRHKFKTHSIKFILTVYLSRSDGFLRLLMTLIDWRAKPVTQDPVLKVSLSTSWTLFISPTMGLNVGFLAELYTEKQGLLQLLGHCFSGTRLSWREDGMRRFGVWGRSFDACFVGGDWSWGKSPLAMINIDFMKSIASY